MDREGRIYFPSDKSKRLQRIRFLDELLGETVDTLWDDIPPINSRAQERIGYPTQKPLALLDRIIRASSNEDDMVLDPFCGCATALVAADRLNPKFPQFFSFCAVQRVDSQGQMSPGRQEIVPM